MDNRFYVYEWYNIDTNEIFYVGKGNGARYTNITQRNQYFKNYYNKYNCSVRKIKTELEEDVAFNLEIELIDKYRKMGQCKCNIANGGEGATFPEGSWNDFFRKLQYLHDVVKAMDDMCNEEDYDPKNLKTKSLEELEELYQDYIEYKEGMATYNELGLNNNELTGFELETQNKEITMLTDMLTQSIANDYKEFSDFLNWKTEVDFICIEFNSDKFLKLLFEKPHYYGELTNVVMNMMYFMKYLNNSLKISTLIKIRSYYIKGNYIHIKFNTSEDKAIRRVKVNLYDIVWGILMFKDKALYCIIYEEIFAAPFI